VRCGRQSAPDNYAVHNRDDWYLTVFDLLEGASSNFSAGLGLSNVAEIRVAE
jgi:hypothetical protein